MLRCRVTATNADGSTTAVSNAVAVQEPVNPNLLLKSQDFSDAVWVLNNLTSITHGVTDPDGGTTASRVSPGGNSDGRVRQTVNLAATGNYTFSIYMRSDAGAAPSLLIRNAVSPFTVYAHEVLAPTADWQRFDVTGDVTVAGDVMFYVRTNSTDTAVTFEIAFAQAEAGASATAYQATL